MKCFSDNMLCPTIECPNRSCEDEKNLQMLIQNIVKNNYTKFNDYDDKCKLK